MISMFTKSCHKLHCSTLLSNLLMHGAYVMHVKRCWKMFKNVARRRQGFN